MKLVELSQFLCYHGTISSELGWIILILISKVNADILWIGILEVLWGVMGSIIDTSIKKDVTFHDFMHRFHAEIVTVTKSMELKLEKELVSMDQDPLFLVFLDLRKSYDKLD